MTHVVGIVQARMGSSRLPNKMMLSLHGYPIIEWVGRRIAKSKRLDDIVFAIPDTIIDDILEYYLCQLGMKVIRGSEDDVLDRFYTAATLTHASHIVRICADNPLVSHEAIDELIKNYFSHQCDYAYNHIPKGNLYPDGLGAEIVSMDLLKTIWKETTDSSKREHIFNYIWENPEIFSIYTFDPLDFKISGPDIKLDIDTISDYKKLLSINIDIDMTAKDIISTYRANHENIEPIN